MLVVVRNGIFSGTGVVSRRTDVLPTDARGRGRHDPFQGFERLTGNESLRQHHKIVCKHRTVHIRLKVIESLPIAAR